LASLDPALRLAVVTPPASAQQTSDVVGSRFGLFALSAAARLL
jgi:hypothetical protein